MKEKLTKNPRALATVLLFALAAALLATSTVGSSRAALTYYSTTYGAMVELQDIGITLKENGTPVDTRNYANNGAWDTSEGVAAAKKQTLLTELIPAGGELHIGQAYPEVLTACNSGTIPVYLRMTVSRYWVDTADAVAGTRDTALAPELIDLALAEGWENNWIKDEAAHTRERDVYYYRTALPADAETEPLTQTLAIKGLDGVQCTVSKETVTNPDGTTTTLYTYTYDGASFVVEASVDAVQTHNAADAIKSAWGVDVTVTDGVLALN